MPSDLITGSNLLSQMIKNIQQKKESIALKQMHMMHIQNKGILQIENLASLHSTFKRPRAIEVQGKLGHLIIHGLQRRIRIHTAPRHIPCWLLKFQIELSCILQTTTPKWNQLQKAALLIAKPTPHQQERRIKKRKKYTIWFKVNMNYTWYSPLKFQFKQTSLLMIDLINSRQLC